MKWWVFLLILTHCFGLKHEADFQRIYENRSSLQEGHIPHIVHLIWLGPKCFPLSSIENVRHWQKFHPDWKFIFWTDKERMPPLSNMEVKLIDKSLFSSLWPEYNESENFGEKSDILRYELLLQYGGIYIDHDADCLRSFETLTSSYDFFSGLEEAHDPIDSLELTLGIGIVGAIPDHPLIKRTIELIKNRWPCVTAQFAARDDAHSLAERVTHRTYLPLTLAVVEKLPDFSNKDVVLPAKYFYPRKGEGIFSTHYYGTSWNHFGASSLYKKCYKNLEKNLHKEGALLRYSILGALSTLILIFAIYRKPI